VSARDSVCCGMRRSDRLTVRLPLAHGDHTLKQVSINRKAAGESQRPRDQETQDMKEHESR
jgi:hypothetical protein